MDFNKLYPNEKTEKSMQYLRDLWSGKKKTAFSAFPNEPSYRQIGDKEEMISKFLEYLEKGTSLPGFNVPRFIPDFGTVSTASYWGGEIYTPAGGCIGIKEIIKTADEVLAVRPSKPEDGHVKRAFELWKEVCTRINTEDLSCSFIDIHGPLNTASLLWKQDEFMMAMYTDPDIVHELLEMITEQIIGIVKAMIKKVGKLSGPLWPYIWLPTDIGIGITEDYMPLLSPKLYKEFGIPYLEKISKEFGGLFIHCCGEYEHQLENLTKSKINILGMEFHYPHTKPEALFKAFGSSALFVPFLSVKSSGEFKSNADFIKYIFDKRQPETRLWFILSSEEPSFNESVEFLKTKCDS